MKITFQMDGGFAYLPALSKPIDIDTTEIDPEVGRQLESLVQETRFFDQPARGDTPAKGAADYRTYTIQVENGSRVHTIQLTDPIKDASLDRLVSQLRLMAGP